MPPQTIFTDQAAVDRDTAWADYWAANPLQIHAAPSTPTIPASDDELVEATPAQRQLLRRILQAELICRLMGWSQNG